MAMLNAPTIECDRVNLRWSMPVQKRQQIFETVPVRHWGTPATAGNCSLNVCHRLASYCPPNGTPRLRSGNRASLMTSSRHIPIFDGHNDVLDCRNGEQGPDDQGQHAENAARCDITAKLGEDRLERIERACTDIPKYDAQRRQAHHGEARLVRLRSRGVTYFGRRC